MGEALSIAIRFFEAPLNFFYELLGRSGMLGFYWAILAMYVAFRFLVAPFLGVYADGLSDTARKAAKQSLNGANKGKQGKRGG